MDFRWNEWNREHIAEHGIAQREAEGVVEQAREHEWVYRGDDKWQVKGPGLGGRLLQVVFILDDGGTIYVIHARPLTEREKRQWRRTTK
jgi:uncharacterized DUF497 family protein